MKKKIITINLQSICPEDMTQKEHKARLEKICTLLLNNSWLERNWSALKHNFMIESGQILEDAKLTNKKKIEILTQKYKEAWQACQNVYSESVKRPKHYSIQK